MELIINLVTEVPAGGGWYGGAGSYPDSGGDDDRGGGGGSGFVWTEENTSNVPEEYNASSQYYLMDTVLLDGNSEQGREGDGFVQIEEVQEPEGIVLLKNISTSEKIIIQENQNILIDLWGKNILTYSDTYITNYGKLKITDSTERQTGVIENAAGTIIENEGELELNGGTIKATKVGTSENRTKVIINKGIYNQTGGNIQSTGGYSYGVYQKEEYKGKEGYGDYTNAELVGNGEYSFKNENGVIKPDMPNDSTTSRKSADSYIKIDLAGKDGIYNLEVNVNMEGECEDSSHIERNTKLYGAISETEEATIENAFMETTNTSGNYDIQLEGGRTYYLHLRYYRYSYYSKGITEITSVEIKKDGVDDAKTVLSEGEINISGNGINHGIYNVFGDVKVMAKGVINVTTSSEYAYGIYNRSSGLIEIEGGEIHAKDIGYAIYTYGIYNYTIGVIKIKEGTISGGTNDGYGVSNNEGKVEMTGGTITESDTGIYNRTRGMIEMTGGTITGGGEGIYNSSIGIVEMKGGTIEKSSYGMYNTGTGLIRMINGTIKEGVIGIYNLSTGKVEMTGGEMTVQNIRNI